MSRVLFNDRSNTNVNNRRVNVAKLRNVLPRHHMGRTNRTPMIRPADTTSSSSG